MSAGGRGSKARPTIRDVATAAGVSKATVSRVLNGGNRVSPDALLAVQSAIARTGYSANRHARALSAGKSNTVAFLLTEPQELLFEDPNFSTLLRGVAKVLGERPDPVMMVLVFASTAAERSRTLDYLTQQVDGVLVVSSHSGDPLVAQLLEAEVPMVAAGRVLGQRHPAAWVAADDVEGARIAVRHLQDQGRTRIATITGPLDTSGGTDRLVGYRDAMGPAYDETLVAHGDYTHASGLAAMEHLLHTAPDLDAVFVCSDLMAAAALTVLRREGRTVPGDVAVVGFDDSTYATATDPPLTTVRQPWERISEEMVRLLLDLIDGGQPLSMSVPTKLVVRGST